MKVRFPNQSSYIVTVARDGGAGRFRRLLCKTIVAEQNDHLITEGCIAR